MICKYYEFSIRKGRADIIRKVKKVTIDFSLNRESNFSEERSQ